MFGRVFSLLYFDTSSPMSCLMLPVPGGESKSDSELLLKSNLAPSSLLFLVGETRFGWTVQFGLLQLFQWSTFPPPSIFDLDLSSLHEGDIINRIDKKCRFLSSTEYRKRLFSRPNSRVCRIRFPALVSSQPKTGVVDLQA